MCFIKLLKSLRSTCAIEATLERSWLDLIDGDKQPEASAPHLVPLFSGLHSLLFPKGREMGRVAFCAHCYPSGIPGSTVEEYLKHVRFLAPQCLC